MEDKISCAECGCELSADNEGLDTYDNGFGILPEGCYRTEDVLCVSCYEETYSSCDECEARLPSDEISYLEGEGSFCSYCRERKERRELVFVSYYGHVSKETYATEAEAVEALEGEMKRARAAGHEIADKPNGCEILEPEDNEGLVPPLCGTWMIRKTAK